ATGNGRNVDSDRFALRRPGNLTPTGPRNESALLLRCPETVQPSLPSQRSPSKSPRSTATHDDAAGNGTGQCTMSGDGQARLGLRTLRRSISRRFSSLLTV